jgi:hypothetical protein
MARVTCRCGEMLTVTPRDPDRLKCPRCDAKIRVRRRVTKRAEVTQQSDGYIRFTCACGRRLKVHTEERLEAGKCPDCGRIVPVSDSAWQAGLMPPSPWGQSSASRSDPNTRTQDMDAADLRYLEQWTARHEPHEGGAPGSELTTTSHQAPDTLRATWVNPQSTPSAVKTEAGLRICPRCARPLHMSAIVCRACGEPVSK